MTSYTKLIRKGLLLLSILSLLALTLIGPVPQPAFAYCEDVVPCPWYPPMHWDSFACECVCDCPDVWGGCGPCV